MPEPVKYVTFGGVQVPAWTMREAIDKNGEKMYCVWDGRGGKVTYPEQSEKTLIPCYKRTQLGYDGFGNILQGEQYISKEMCQRAFNDYRAEEKSFVTSYGYDLYSASIETRENGYNITTRYYTSFVDNKPKIDMFISSGVMKIHGTQNMVLSNINGATVTGSIDEDDITLRNSSNCTVDVSNANNNFFVSDNVTVVNGKNNNVKAGAHDQVRFGTFNYETATATINADHKGEGTYKQ